MAVVSHELRTPINAVLGWAKMLESGTVRDDRVAPAVSSISRNAASLAKMIEDLLDTSRMFSGRMRLSLSEIDLRALTLEAIDSVRVSAEQKRVAIHTDLPPSVPPVSGVAGVPELAAGEEVPAADR